MKICIAIGLATFLTAACYADIAIYNGFEVVNTTSLDGTSNVARKSIEVIDLENSQVVFITFGSAVDKGRKQSTFEVGAPIDVLLTKVQDSRGNKRSFTALAYTDSTTDTATGITELSSFLQSGGDLKNVVIEGTESTLLPRNMHAAAWLLSTASSEESTGPDVASSKMEIKMTFVLQEKLSRTSNDEGDTLAEAVDRLRADLLAEGLTEILPPPPAPVEPTPPVEPEE
jgi:hypothetical protein